MANDQSGTGINGVAGQQSSEQAASKLAMKHCKKNGGKSCKVAITYTNGCIAIATPHVGGRGVGGIPIAETGADLPTISIRAAAQCEVDNRKACEIAYSECSLPYLR